MELERFLTEYEPTVRLGFFFGVFLLVALGELVAPRRRLSVPKGRRWASNFGIVVLNTVLLRVLFPTAAVGMALFTSEHSWGVLNYLDGRYLVELVVAVVA